MSIAGPRLTGLLSSKQRHDKFCQTLESLSDMEDSDAIGRYMTIKYETYTAPMWSAYHSEWREFKANNPGYTDFGNTEPRISEELMVQIVQKERRVRGIASTDKTQRLASHLQKTAGPYVLPRANADCQYGVYPVTAWHRYHLSVLKGLNRDFDADGNRFSDVEDDDLFSRTSKASQDVQEKVSRTDSNVLGANLEARLPHAHVSTPRRTQLSAKQRIHAVAGVLKELGSAAQNEAVISMLVKEHPIYNHEAWRLFYDEYKNHRGQLSPGYQRYTSGYQPVCSREIVEFLYAAYRRNLGQAFTCQAAGKLISAKYGIHDSWRWTERLDEIHIANTKETPATTGPSPDISPAPPQAKMLSSRNSASVIEPSAQATRWKQPDKPIDFSRDDLHQIFTEYGPAVKKGMQETRFASMLDREFGTNDVGYWLNNYDAWINGDGIFGQADTSAHFDRRDEAGGGGPSKRQRL